MKSKRKSIEEEYADSEIVFADGFDTAIIGVALPSLGNENHTKVVYDYNKCVSILCKRDKMSHEEAVEFLEFNTLGAYVGKNTPLFMELA